MGTKIFATLLHPGDLSAWEMAGLVGVLIGFFVLPIVIIAFIIFRVIVRRSRKIDSITLSLEDRRGNDS